MKLITEKGLSGYRLSDIKKTLTADKFKQFMIYMNGQTIGILKGEKIIYEIDWLRFLKGLPPLD